MAFPTPCFAIYKNKQNERKEFPAETMCVGVKDLLHSLKALQFGRNLLT